jgi:hypothetical protein
MASRNTLRLNAALAFTIALALVPGAAAETLIPPGNSAVNQYTESYPSGRGEVNTGSRQGNRTPEQVLGKRKAQRLESQGATGEEVATVVAATAPTQTDGNGTGMGGSAPGQLDRSSLQPGGSAGFGEVLDQAIGVSSGDGPGLLLPLGLLAIMLWALAYAWRRWRSAAS